MAPDVVAGKVRQSLIAPGERHVSFKLLMAVPTDWDAEMLDRLLSVLASLLARDDRARVRYVDGRWSAPGLGLKPLPSTGVAKVLSFKKEAVMAVVTQQETWVQLIELLGQNVRIENPDETGGAGKLVQATFTRSADGGVGVELELDYGYGFMLQEGTLVVPAATEPTDADGGYPDGTPGAEQP